MAIRDFFFPVGTFDLPALAGEFIHIAIISEFHHKVNSRRAVSIIIVIRLPQRAKRIDRHLVVVAEIVTQHFHIGQVLVASEHHPLTIRLATVIYNASPTILDGIAIPIT